MRSTVRSGRLRPATPRASRRTTRSFLERWLRDVAAARVRPRTLDGYRQTIETHIFPHVGHVRLTQLTPQCLQAWLTVLKTRGVSTGRQRYSRVVLRAALSTAVKWQLLPRNPATLIDVPRAVAREMRTSPLLPDFKNARFWLRIW